ncbi:hypothetical protein QM996_09210 [Sinorhizobium chiapasense]
MRFFALVLVALIASSSNASASSGERVLNALLACNQQFFAVVEDEKETFGPVTIEYRMEDGEIADYIVSFEKPVEIWGLQFIGYRQSVLAHGRAYAWALIADHDPATTFNAVKKHYAEAAQFSNYRDSWIRSYGEPGKRTRHLLVHVLASEQRSQSLLACQMTRDAMGWLSPWPDPADIFIDDKDRAGWFSTWLP